MSADTLRRLVELARIKQQREREAARSPKEQARNSHIRHSHTMSRKDLTRGFSPKDPAEKVKKRLSITDPNHLPPVRSFSLPKGSMLPDIADEGNLGDHGRLESAESGSAFTTSSYDQSEPEIHIPPPRDTSSASYGEKKRDSKTISASYSSSYTQSSNPNAQYFTLKDTKPGEYRKEMSVASQSSISHEYSSTYHSNVSFATSTTITQDPGFPPPMLDNISEASGWDTTSNYWGESVPPSTRSDNSAAPFNAKARVSLSDVDPTQDPEPIQIAGGGGGLFSCFPCMRNASTNNDIHHLQSDTQPEPARVDAVSAIEMKSREEHHVRKNVASNTLPPPMLDQLTATTASRLRRPTQFSHHTIGVDDTMTEHDIHMWVEPFGRGASGRVYKAIYLPMCTLVACKVTSRLSKDTIRQLLEECRAQMEKLPDIEQLLKILGWYKDRSTNEFVIALEYMDLGSVFDSCFLDSPAAEQARERETDAGYVPEEINKSGHKAVFVSKLHYEQIRHIAREVLLALHVLHTLDKPLVHRDIKPQNILIASTGEVKLADFGLLYQLRNAEARCRDAKGTRKYFSPERIDCNFGVGSDIWAFGITMIEILQQRLVSPHRLNDFKIQQGLQPTEFLGATVPTEFVSFIGACLQKNPIKRPPAKILLTHPYIKGAWGIPAVPSEPSLQMRVSPVSFLTAEPDHGMLDTFLSWLEDWILADDDSNANLFLQGDDADLLRCLESMSKWTGFGTLYIETLISEQYREFMNSV